MSVGFDLDHTLYPKNSKIDNIVRKSIAKKILERKPELGSIKEAIFFYKEEYGRVGSGTHVLRNLGCIDAQEIMKNSLENPDILKSIKKDSKLASLLKDIKNKYKTFLITASPQNLAIQKLRKIGINLELFDTFIFGDTLNAGKKIDGSIFKYFLNESPYLPEQHVYIGDSFNADIIPAKSLGMKTIVIGKKIPEADFFIEKIYDLESLLL